MTRFAFLAVMAVMAASSAFAGEIVKFDPETGCYQFRAGQDEQVFLVSNPGFVRVTGGEVYASMDTPQSGFITDEEPVYVGKAEVFYEISRIPFKVGATEGFRKGTVEVCYRRTLEDF